MVQKYQALVYTVCHQLVPDVQEAQDLTQETFLAAWRAIDRCPPGFEKQWLARIAANKAKDYLRSAWVRKMNTPGDEVLALVLLGCEVLFFAARPGRWKYDFVSVLVCLVLMAGCFCMAMLPLLWDEVSGENQQTMNRLSAQAIDELYTACKRDAQDIAIRDISGRLYLSGPQAETLQQAAALPAGDVYLTLTVELFGPYDSAAAFARDCYTLTALAKQCTVPPESLHFTWDARSPAESSLNTGSLLYTEDYSLDLSGAVQLDWTEQQMEQQTETEYLLDAENIPDED